MLAHPCNLELSNYTATQRKTSSTTTYRAGRDSGADLNVEMRVCLIASSMICSIKDTLASISHYDEKK